MKSILEINATYTHYAKHPLSQKKFGSYVNVISPLFSLLHIERLDQKNRQLYTCIFIYKQEQEKSTKIELL